jgi:hypothetical protein
MRPGRQWQSGRRFPGDVDVTTAPNASICVVPPPTTQAAIVWELDPYYSEGFLARSPAQKVALQITAP